MRGGRQAEYARGSRGELTEPHRPGSNSMFKSARTHIFHTSTSRLHIDRYILHDGSGVWARRRAVGNLIQSRYSVPCL